ncbi:MAG: hypothetical protein KKF16_06285 [Euryarchaeota archaeon]|nr:hypothetical protein [Euryarchaeota archaeon]MBU4608911.1 hypothetical protein [Euryarchaeota archaeon]MBV1729962.1 hypothetical protein [Methanobacterium sp.]MBV1755961.1 hypothetical protein [Methanobacterium sp.]
MVNKKYVVVVAVIIISSAAFLLTQPAEGNICEECGMINCEMDHSNNTTNTSHEMKEEDSGHGEQ